MSILNKNGWSFWIDRGGTFTDIIACDPNGNLHANKVLSQSAEGKDAVIAGINQTLELFQLDPKLLSSVRMGTTVGTNALLQRRGVATVLVTTKGFQDAVRIAYQARPKIFAQAIILPEMIYEEVIEFEERIDASGSVLTSPDLQKLKCDLELARQKGFRACAIALMHAYKFPEHEILAGRLASELGFEQISLSHDCAALMKFVSRADTTLVDAYLTPLLSDYIKTLRADLGNTELQFMQSNGGLVDSARFRGKDSILSGPAGGLVGAVKTARACGFNNLITFDMGGTSTDVAYFQGEIEHTYETEIAGIRIRAPMMDIHTVAAGGGSILKFDGARYLVGPESSGANPGPMSYRRQGPLSLTDANLMLGRIQTSKFPSIFGPAGNEPLDLDSVANAFAELSQEIRKKTGDNRDPHEVACGFVKIAITKMANAIKHVSIQRGHDIRDCALVCFGGAAGQHACLIAEELGIKNVLIHPLAGLLSAYGIGLSETALTKELDVNESFSKLNQEELLTRIRQIHLDLRRALAESQKNASVEDLKLTAHVKMSGSDYAISVPFADKEKMATEFKSKHLNRYGYFDEKRELILDSVSVRVQEEVKKPLQYLQANIDAQKSKPLDFHQGKIAEKELPKQNPQRKIQLQQVQPAQEHVRIYSLKHSHAGTEPDQNSAWLECPLIPRSSIVPGQVIAGPALIYEQHTCTVLEAGWQAEVLACRTLLIRNMTNISPPQEHNDSSKADPVLLEIFNNLFSFVAEQMGLTLQNTSQSVNIKERLDFSCAIFDAAGNLLANAPHIPVHLGSMSESVKSLIEARGPSMQAGDAYATNDPFNGGTHLPDITVISPAFVNGGKNPLFYVASRGHHADVGGITPGSMPSESKSIEEEGIMFKHMLVMRHENVLNNEIESQLKAGNFPARNVPQNLADLKAQIAANTSGIKQMLELMNKWGEKTVLDYMQYVQDNAEYCVRTAIANLNSGQFQTTMDDGSIIAVRIEIDKMTNSAHIDFSGTSAQSSSNFNAPLSICKACVLYVFRTLVSEDIPLNAGCFRPLRLTVPPGSLLNPDYPAAVVAGNVESSQVIVDALYAALGIMAASQGTMNNLSFGNERYQYYETICGGSGAGGTFHGAGPVQTHMTNSRLTDPEVLESRYPVLLQSFSVRKNSGGSGKFHGGNGAVRSILFREPMTGSILSNRRLNVPYGLQGGSAGYPGRNYILHADKSQTLLPFRTSFELRAGDCLVIETPGGGGFGRAEP